MEASSIDIGKILIEQVTKKGIEAAILPRFIKDLFYSFSIDPVIGLSEVNDRMHRLGWDEAEVDYHTLELARASFERDQLLAAI